MLSDRERERIGYLLKEVLDDLPPKAIPFVKGLAINLEDRPKSGPHRLWDASAGALRGHPERTNIDRYPGNEAILHAAGCITLYLEPILETGGELSDVLRATVLIALEGKLGVDPGALSRPVGDDKFFWQPDDPDHVDELVDDPAAPEPSDSLAELAESEIELLSTQGRDWFDEVEIAAVEEPEAEGDPARLADFPEPDDDPKALVLYSKNILRRPEPPEVTVRAILREALRRAGVNPK